MDLAGTGVGDTGWGQDSVPGGHLPLSLLWHREGEALLLPAPHLPGIRTVSSSPVWMDVGSLLNRAGGDGQGRDGESLTGPTRKVPVTMGAVRGSAVWKAMLEAAWDLRGCLEGPS